jgi:hypothetical protein
LRLSTEELSELGVTPGPARTADDQEALDQKIDQLIKTITANDPLVDQFANNIGSKWFRDIVKTRVGDLVDAGVPHEMLKLEVRAEANARLWRRLTRVPLETKERALRHLRDSLNWATHSAPSSCIGSFSLRPLQHHEAIHLTEALTNSQNKVGLAIIEASNTLTRMNPTDRAGRLQAFVQALKQLSAKNRYWLEKNSGKAMYRADSPRACAALGEFVGNVLALPNGQRVHAIDALLTTPVRS